MRAADAIIILWGWRRAAVASIAGAVSALALAPFNAFPVLWATIPVFIWLLDGAVPPEGSGPLRRFLTVFGVGWWFGFGYFLAGLWWLGAAFLVDADAFAWLMPLGVVALPALLALFWGLGAALARLIWSDGWARLFAFAAAMSAAEWLRGHLFTGFPWNAFGYALMPTPALMQAAALVGLWGVTLLAFLVFGAPVLLAAGLRRDRRSRWTALAAIAFLLLADIVTGAARLRHADAGTVEGVRLRIVQPAIEQSEKWQAGRAGEIFQRFLELSDGTTGPGRDGAGSATHIIWPESAFPFLLTERPDALQALADLLPDGTTLIAGATRADPPAPGGGRRFFNSLYVIAADGEIEAAYDKVHLVPFGEYLPFQAWLEGLGIEQLTRLPGGYSAGPRLRSITLRDAPAFGPLICYEAIFPGAVTEPGNRPGWLLNLTNDAWYGDTPGPRQHFRQAAVRAVEEGLPLVRAANSGISAIVDPYGRTVAMLGVGESGILDGVLPRALPPTPYARLGDAPFLVLLLLLAGLGAAGRVAGGKIVA